MFKRHCVDLESQEDSLTALCRLVPQAALRTHHNVGGSTDIGSEKMVS